MEDVRCTFTDHAMTNYIDNEAFCASHIIWSGAFASRICDSLAYNEIPVFIATEEEKKKNCVKLWNTMVHNLNSTDLTMARTIAHWNILFGLKCEEKGDFLQFYSKFKSILHKLKRYTSVTVTDDVFFRTYLSKVIEAHKLQNKVKKLIKDKTGTYESILELICQDYRAEEMGEALRDGETSFVVLFRRTKQHVPSPELIAKTPPVFHIVFLSTKVLSCHLTYTPSLEYGTLIRLCLNQRGQRRISNGSITSNLNSNSHVHFAKRGNFVLVPEGVVIVIALGAVVEVVVMECLVVVHNI